MGQNPSKIEPIIAKTQLSPRASAVEQNITLKELVAMLQEDTDFMELVHWAFERKHKVTINDR